MDDSKLSEALARLVVETRWQDIPAPVRHETKRALLNWLGCAIGGSGEIAVETSLKVMTPFSGKPEATVLGRSERLDALSAAFINGVSANVYAFDDTHLRTVIHPSAPLLPALFAMSELRPVSGIDLLLAFVLGVEVECRIGNAVSPQHYSHGWHITSTCGVIGAAAAVAKLLDLDHQHMLWALGAGAMQSAGLVENLGTMAKNLTVGNAPRGGMIAAMLAEGGMNSSLTPLEGRFGFLNVMSAAPPVPTAITSGLGETWELMQNTYKPYPSGVVMHPVIDACLELREQGLTAEDVEHVTVKGAPLLRERGDRPKPINGREALVSNHHCVAIALIYGKAGVEEFTDAVVDNPAVRALGARVSCEDDLSIPVEGAAVEVTTKTGGHLRAYVPAARGSLARPLSDADIETKVRGLISFAAPSVDASKLIDAAWRFDELDDASTLLPLTVPAR
jgi:2-methylcitrate dehydratase PrpD